MKKEIYVSGLDIPVVIRSYRKSKTVKILYKNDYLKVTKPYWYNQKNIIKYLEENCEKIKSEYIKFSNKKVKDDNITKILYLGNIYNVCVIYNNKTEDVFFDGNNICIKVKKDKITNDELRNIIKSYLKEKAKFVIKQRLDYISNIMNIKYNAFRIKDCKTMWGSCSIRKNLNFNYKLIMFPYEIMDQIIIHELCHIKYLNHSDSFWNLLYKYCDKDRYKEGKRWIKNNSNLINII